jgi:LacI family transcriptional regulator
MSARRIVTIRDIAAAAGLGRTAVSLALRNHSSIPPQTRQRVQQVAEELGYRPNPLISALMMHKRAASAMPQHLPIALVTQFQKPSPWEYGWVLPELHQGLADRAVMRGYRLEEFWTRSPGMSMRRLSKILQQRGIPGVVVCPLPVAHGHLSLDWANFAAISIGYTLVRPALHRVIGHHVHGVQVGFASFAERAGSASDSP